VSESNPIRVFVTHAFQETDVTHAFQETDDYLRVFEFLESVDRFFYLNVSKPDNVPESGGIEAIKEELISQIKEAEAVIVLPSLYEEKESLARFLMDAADVNHKPMIAIRPFGGAFRGAARNPTGRHRAGKRAHRVERSGDRGCPETPGPRRRYGALGDPRLSGLG
jgi:hypothetical protein